MSITLDDEQTQHIFLTLVESLEGGERLPTKILVTYLQHPEDSIRRLAIELLEYGNDPAAIPALLRAAADANIEVSLSASEVLRSFRNPSAVKQLIEGLRHPAPETRLAAVVALRERRAPDAVKGLLRNISDVESEVRREAVIALAHYRNHDLLPALRSALRDKSPAVRKVTVTAVAEFDGALVFDDLVAALSDDNWQVRREAAIALGRFPGQAAEAALRDTLGDSAWQVAREAALSLSRLQAGDHERLTGLLLHEVAAAIYIASLSSGLLGAGNALLVPETSTVQNIRELKGKTVSVPFASTAHAFLLRAVKDQGWDPEKDITIVTQMPEVGGSALKAGQIEAHANFVPFGELFPFRGFARKILDGSSTGVPTTHGVQVRSDFVEKYPEIVVAYLKASLEGDRLLRDDPEGLAEQHEKWTGIEAEVFYSFHGPHGIQARDYTFKPEVLNAIASAAATLKILKKTSHDIKVSEFVDDRYIRQAAKELGLDYDARLENYSAVPFDSKDFVTGEEVIDAKKAGQIWVDGEKKVRLYKDVPSTFIALNQLEKDGKTVRVAFVHDRETGLKLFADKVWYIRKDNDIAAFLEKSGAEKWAQANNGNLLTYAEARKFVGGERVAQAR